MVPAGHPQATCGDELVVHPREDRRLIVVRADVERLHATAFAERLDPQAVEERGIRGPCARTVDEGIRDPVGYEVHQRPFPPGLVARHRERVHRSEEHTSELQSLMPTSYAVSCLK